MWLGPAGSYRLVLEYWVLPSCVEDLLGVLGETGWLGLVKMVLGRAHCPTLRWLPTMTVGLLIVRWSVLSVPVRLVAHQVVVKQLSLGDEQF